MTDLLKAVHPRVAKEVAHLTYAQIGVTPEQRQWPFVRIAVGIDSALKEFVALLPTDFIRPAVETAQVPQGPVTEVGSKGPSGA